MPRLCDWTKTALLIGSLAIGGAACYGDAGDPGDPGDPGSPGDPGDPGLSALVSITIEPAGANCADGGQKIETGVDDNANGVLDPGEVDNTIYVCNGGDGGDGGVMLVNVTPEAAGANCANGGQKIETGLDANANGILDPDEVDTIDYVCNGADLVPTSSESCSTCHGIGKTLGVDAVHPDPLPPLTLSVTAIDNPADDHLVVSFHAENQAGEAVTNLSFAELRFYLADIVPMSGDTNGNGVIDGSESDGADRVEAVTNSDSLDWDTATWTFANGNFTVADVGLIFRITGTSNGNDGYYHIESVTNATTILTTAVNEEPDGGDETFVGTESLILDREWDTPYLERWAYERSTSAAGTFTNLGGGDYAYRFSTVTGAADPVLAPDYDPSHTQRLLIRAANPAYSNAVAVQDFTLPGTLVAPQRVLAPSDGCKKCHSPAMENAAHAGGYLDTRACVICHSPRGSYGARMLRSGAHLSNFIHQIHSAIANDAWASRLDGRGYGAVTYPRDTRDCAICHTGSEHMTDSWKTNPSIEACSSCHNTLDITDVDTSHGGESAPLQQLDSDYCKNCHPPADIVNRHAAVAPNPRDVPEFDLSLALTAPANTTHYVAGEAPLVTVTVRHADDDSEVDPAFYTTGRGPAGFVADTALAVASVYIYGPRAHAVPVLATNTSTDPAYDPTTLPTQGHPMFTGGTDPLVQSDVTGFKYQLLAIPADMEPGTYLVRVRVGDYGRVDPGNYRIESTAFTTIQIGAAAVSPKVAGDGCVGCHGPGNFTAHDERHAVVFDTDECLSCHDYSGNHAVYIGNRAHAIHSANSDGDYYNLEGGARDWDEVTFPSSTQNCTICHDSAATTYKAVPRALPCAGCHVATTNTVLDHMRQNGGPF